MLISYLLEKNGLSEELLSKLSRQSSMELSLKRNLHLFDKDDLLADVDSAIEWYDSEDNGELLGLIDIDYRIKSIQSAHLKYGRYYPNTPAEKVFNDLIGFRGLCDDYSELNEFDRVDLFRIADMSKGKANDDGYRGVHVYFQIDHHHYPIEIQYNTYYDRQINDWLHAFLYKKDYPPEVGANMRRMYENGLIKSANDFMEVLENVLSGS